jgi:hypothetical protein
MNGHIYLFDAVFITRNHRNITFFDWICLYLVLVQVSVVAGWRKLRSVQRDSSYQKNWIGEKY